MRNITLKITDKRFELLKKYLVEKDGKSDMVGIRDEAQRCFNESLDKNHGEDATGRNGIPYGIGREEKEEFLKDYPIGIEHFPKDVVNAIWSLGDYSRDTITTTGLRQSLNVLQKIFLSYGIDILEMRMTEKPETIQIRFLFLNSIAVLENRFGKKNLLRDGKDKLKERLVRMLKKQGIDAKWGEILDGPIDNYFQVEKES